MAILALFSLLTLLAAACGDDGATAGSDPSTATAPSGLGAAERARADELVSLFENSTPELQYDYVAALDDGRGVTAGRAGFTSATGDLLLVVTGYLAENPESTLAAFLPVLEARAADGSGDLAGLEAFPAAWTAAGDDPAMRRAQDEVVDELYFDPAMAIAADEGLRLPLTLVAIYDTAIQHGIGDDSDGLPALMAETTARIPDPAANETAWLAAFLEIRRRHLEHAADPETRAAWQESTGRVDTLQALLAEGNLEFAPTAVDVYGDHFDLS